MNLNASIPWWRPLDRFRGSVVLRLFAVIFAFSCVVTVALTAVQLYRDYRHGAALVRQRLSEADRIYGDSLAEALWRLDKAQLKVELDGILRLGDISAVQVRDGDAGSGPLVVSSGNPFGVTAAISRDFPIMRKVDGKQRQIGTLHVEATLASLYRSLARTAALILVNQAANTFLVAVFIIWLLTRLVTRHLAAIARAVSRYDHRELSPQLVLHRRTRAVPDEFDRVVCAINGMAARVHLAYLDERQAAAEREARLAAEAASRAKNAFLANMSHELRTPLNGILGYAQILRRDGTLGAAQREAVAVVLRCGEQLLALIQDVLDLAMIEAGRTRVEIGDVSPAEAVNSIREVIAIKAAEKDLGFVCDIASDVPSAVRADARRLGQVLLNLLTNAVKFTAQGVVELHVRRSASGGALFEVTDTGRGIPSDDLERIFLPFEQGSRNGDRDGGMGLGLAISRQFLHAMGSDIVTQSEAGRGSVFRFELPASTGTGELAFEHRTERMATGYPGPRRTVLVVDDIAINRAVLADFLRSLGFYVITAESALDALDALARSNVSLVLTDIIMPGIDGLGFIRRVRALSVRSDVPIVALSASSSEADAGKALLAGANAFLPKPIDFNRLQTEIAALLDLTWHYSTHRHGQDLDFDYLAKAILPTPPAESMRELHRLARMGDMRGVRGWADALGAADARYEPFACALLALARAYQSKVLLAFVERHLQGGGAS